MKKTTAGANDLKKLVADGKTHDIIIEIAFKTIQNTEHPGGKFSLDLGFITKFIKEGW